jgi:hypothetical protein
VKSSLISNFSDGEAVGFFTLATGSLRDNKLRTLDICRDLAVARSRVLLACPFRLVWITVNRQLRLTIVTVATPQHHSVDA